MESDRKIRTLSLLKFSRFCLSDIDEAIQSQLQNKDSIADSVADLIVDGLQFKQFPSASDANVIFTSVATSPGRSLGRPNAIIARIVSSRPNSSML